jgi:hypothetical protein
MGADLTQLATLPIYQSEIPDSSQRRLEWAPGCNMQQYQTKVFSL